MVNHYTGQYHAASPPAARMQDLTVAAKRSRLRVVVGHWELRVGFERALAADDERDRRRQLREDAVLAGIAVSGTALENLLVPDPEAVAAEVSA